MDDDLRLSGTAVELGGAEDGGLTAIVGVGVGLASLRSLERMFATVEPDLGAAFLIAVRQDEGLQVDTVLETLARATDIPVRFAVDGEALAPDRIYVGGRDDMLTLEDGHLRVRPASEPVGHRGMIDSMLISQAEHAHDRAVAVILAGLGSDGAAGVTATKKFGGLSIVERGGEEAAGAGAVGPAAVADLHLPAEEIGRQIALYAANLAYVVAPGSGDGDTGDLETQISQIVTILRNVTSHDFHGYKRGTFVRRVQRRMQVLQIDQLPEYVARLRAESQEVRNLFQDMLIGVTQFFRDPEEFEALERELPRLLAGKGPQDQFRVWVLGCATGEEAYSIAMLLREHLSTLDHPPEVQIFATDLDARALGLARAGRYSAASVASNVRPDRLERWFVREGDTYCVAKELREMCVFSPHNIVKDAPFSRLDILSCRNLLIYLSVELQNRVIPIFHFGLKPGGVLFLGASENVTRHGKLFAPVDRKNRLFRRLETATRIVPDFPLTPRPRGSAAPEPVASPVLGRLTASVGRQAEAIAERYAPAYVIVDLHGDVLHFSGRIGRYIEPSAGAPTLSLAGLVHRDLRLDVRSALSRASAESGRVEIPRLLLRQDDRTFGVNLIVEPIGGGEVNAFAVVFQDLGPMAADALSDADQPSADEHVQRLEAELRVTRDRLQATIEEQESTNEELKSSNEEYQSINEEMQSTNEELETSKEELQSVNEELQTVNGELGHRVSELGRANSDLNNLLESTQIATIFLDGELRVRNFTPATREIFHLLETDVGRPLHHVVSRVAYPELHDDVRKVLKTLAPIERQVTDTAADRHFSARVLPYRSLDNFISGAVVTFTDLTDMFQAQKALRESEARFRAFVTASSDAVYRMGPDWTEMRYLEGRAFMPDTDAPSDRWMDTYIAAEDRTAVRAAIDEAVSRKALFALEHRVRRVDGSLGWTYSRAVPVLDEAGRILEWLGTASDISARREGEAALRESERRQQVLIEGVPQLVWRAVDGGEWTWASPQWSGYTAQPEPESHGLGWLQQLHPDDRAPVMAQWKSAVEQGEFTAEYRVRHASEDRYRWFQARAMPVRDDGGAVVEWLGTSTDVDDQRQLQERQRVLVAELQHRVRNMLTVIRSVFSRTVEAGGDAEDVAAHFTGRLDALARTQVIVTQNASGTADLETLVRDELLSVAVTDGPNLTIEGPNVQLSSKTIESLGLAIHELTTNALKYGALKTPNAKLDIRWTVEVEKADGRARLNLVWTERGVAAVSVKPAREGFGRELIEDALPYRLGAKTKLEFLGGGVRCSISLPIPMPVPRTEEDAA